MRTWGNFRRTRPRIVKGTRDSGTDLLTKHSCLQDSWSFGSDPNRVREEGGKSPGSLQVSVKVELPQVPGGGCGGWGVSPDDTKAHPG